MPVKRLHFVYNVEATPKALVKDFIHRITAPQTYPCRLCDITYGRFVKKTGWMLFLRSLPVPSKFYTKDRFHEQYPAIRCEFPVILAENQHGEFSEFLSSAEFAAIHSLAELKAEVLTRLGTK